MNTFGKWSIHCVEHPYFCNPLSLFRLRTRYTRAP